MDGLAIAASLREVRPAAEGGFVRSIYQPTRTTLVLHVFARQSRRILVAPRHAAIHVTELGLSNPPKPSPFVMLLRRHLRGGRILAVRQRGWDRVVTFDIERRGGRTTRMYELIAELAGVHGNLFLLDGGRVLGSAHRDRRNRPGDVYGSLRPQAKLDPTTVSIGELSDVLRAEPAMPALTRSIEGIGRWTARDILRDVDESADVGAQANAVAASLRAILACIEDPSPCVSVEEARATFYPLPPPAEPTTTFGGALDGVADVLAEDRGSKESTIRSDLQREIARRARTLEKLREWLDNAAEADRLQSLGDLLMIHHTEIAPKSERVVLPDPTTGQEKTVRLLPSLSAIENAQGLYERAKRLRRGRPHVASRIERLEREVRSLEEAVVDFDDGLPVADVALVLLAPPPARADGKRRSGLPPIQAGGFSILVGKSATQNDRLLREAAADDLWLHAKGFAGSHVIIKRGGQREIPEAVVRRAARLAARHSKARRERRVQVVVAAVKHVRKPRGVAPGLVNVSKSDTLTVEL
jgi:predicted ribosome quality control (RQC) complex YloA/Tae2 family protein